MISKNFKPESTNFVFRKSSSIYVKYEDLGIPLSLTIVDTSHTESSYYGLTSDEKMFVVIEESFDYLKTHVLTKKEIKEKWKVEL